MISFEGKYFEQLKRADDVFHRSISYSRTSLSLGSNSKSRRSIWPCPILYMGHR